MAVYFREMELRLFAVIKELTTEGDADPVGLDEKERCRASPGGVFGAWGRLIGYGGSKSSTSIHNVYGFIIGIYSILVSFVDTFD